MRVEVYFNLHKHLFSVRSARSGRVILHTDKVHLRNPEFVVRQGGRQRVLREGKKNVHAFVRGDCPFYRLNPRNATLDTITYNPYKYETFVYEDNGKPCLQSDYAELTIVKGREKNRGKVEGIWE